MESITKDYSDLEGLKVNIRTNVANIVDFQSKVTASPIDPQVVQNNIARELMSA